MYERENTYSFAEVAELLSNDTAIFQADTASGPYLILCDKDIINDSTAITAAAYRTYVSDTIAKATRDVIESDRQVHWVWFRKSPLHRLTEEIVLRAASWIKFNPTFTFHLWTSIRDADELADWLADLSPHLREPFTSGCITVHYAAEFYITVFTWLSENCPHIVSIFQMVWDSTERQDIVMKTDYTRNILLAARGGIYADFNDLLCLMPMESFLVAHAGEYVGVSDITSPAYASNYFMYAAADNTTWGDIVIRCTSTIDTIRTLIYDTATLDVVRDFILGNVPDIVDRIHTVMCKYSSDPTIRPDSFYKAIEMAIAQCIATPRFFYQKRGPDYAIQLKSFIVANRDAIAAIVNTDQFAVAWRFARTDMYLRIIMYSTNLPIFCREQGIPIYMLPFSYLLRYACLLSYVGHLGDGTSYGMEPSKRVTIAHLTGDAS